MRAKDSLLQGGGQHCGMQSGAGVQVIAPVVQ